MKNAIKFLAVIVLAAIIGISMIACDTGSGNGGGGDFTVTINNIHSSFNNIRIRGNNFMLLDTTSGDACGQNYDSTILNGSVTTTFDYDSRMERWGGIIVEMRIDEFDFFVGTFNSTATFPVSQRRIVIDASNMIMLEDETRRLSDPR